MKKRIKIFLVELMFGASVCLEDDSPGDVLISMNKVTVAVCMG